MDKLILWVDELNVLGYFNKLLELSYIIVLFGKINCFLFLLVVNKWFMIFGCFGIELLF